MRNYKKIQTEKNTVTKIVCNKCKKEITIKNGIPEEEREKARQEYLDKCGMHEDFRW